MYLFTIRKLFVILSALSVVTWTTVQSAEAAAAELPASASTVYLADKFNAMRDATPALSSSSAVNGGVAVAGAKASMPKALEDVVVRYPVANSSVPVSAAVEVPASASIVYLSGKLPPVQDTTQPLDSPLAYGGDTKGQTVAVFNAIERALADIGLTLGDVVKVQIFLVGDPALGNKMDINGFTEAYAQFFGTAKQPNLPARTLLQIAGLANSALRVEVDVIAVRRQ